MITIFTPKADHEALHPEVLGGLLLQKDVKWSWVVLSRPKPEKPIGDGKTVEDAVSDNKNLLRTFSNNEYILWLDSDVVLTSDHDLFDLRKALDEHPEIDGFALDTKDVNVVQRIERKGHVVCACVMVRKITALNTIWNARQHDGSPGCACLGYNKALKLRYLDNRKLKEVER